MSDEIEARLREHLAGLDRMPVADTDAVVTASRRIDQRRRRRRQIGVGAVAAALVVGGGAVGWTQRSEPTRLVSTVTEPSTILDESTAATEGPATSPAATDQPTGTPRSWVAIGADPRGPVEDAAVVWTGTEALVVGGIDRDRQPVGGAVAYDPTGAGWRRLADQPLSSTRIDALAAWTGTEMLVIGGTNADGSLLVSAGEAYDPASDHWRIIASPPTGFVTERSPAVWTGSELLIWPGDSGFSSMPTTPIAYDPVTDVWRELPEPPVSGRQQAASVWTGTEWIVWGGTTGAAELADGAAYDPATDTWRVIAPSPLAARRVRAVWTGSEMIVAAGSSGGSRTTGDGEMALDDGAAYAAATDTWRTIRSGPAHPGFVPVWTGRQLVMFAKGTASTYDLQSDRWSDRCCDPAGTVAVWTGSSVLLIGSFDAGRGGSLFTPDAAAT